MLYFKLLYHYLAGASYTTSTMQNVHVLYGIIGFSIFLLSLFLFILWALSQIQRRKTEALEQAHLYAEVMAQEKDKAHITYQLHENFAQVMAGVRMFMGRFTLTNEEEVKLREDATKFLDDSISEIRGMALEYLPYALRKNKLETALQEYIQYVNKDHNDFIKLEIPEPLPTIGSDKSLALYRIVQEIIDNTITHAKATELVILVKEEEDKLLLKTKDNGIGFDYEKELEKAKGAGLNNINTRIKLLKGDIQVETIMPGGTLYIIEAPL